MRLRELGALLYLALCACATVPMPEPAPPNDSGVNYPDPDVENPGVIIVAEPITTPPPPPTIPAPPPPPMEAPSEPIYETPSDFARLSGWAGSDHRPALQAFARGCEAWLKADQTAYLNPKQKEYGRYQDWAASCLEAQSLRARDAGPWETRSFFEAQFSPITLSSATGNEGVLTGYYEPEIDVRLTPDAIYSEPILAKPQSKSIQTLPRSKLSATSSRVIAYGTPIDVFFMQIQGSGRIKFADGRSVRAAYAGNNSKTYKSIGKILIARGEMTLEQASKQAIADWMQRNGPVATRELMNQNPRYIYFTEQAILEGEGPRGAMRVPLTAMGSIAVDNRYHPYGSLVWLETTLPQYPGDYRGQPASLLVTAQDTGNAIRGPLRGDLFFGAGDIAGDMAGVMKHPVTWTLLLPKTIAPRAAGTS